MGQGECRGGDNQRNNVLFLLMRTFDLWTYFYSVSAPRKGELEDNITLGLIAESHYRADTVVDFELWKQNSIQIMRRTGNNWRMIRWGLINDTKWYKWTSWNYDLKKNKNQDKAALASRDWGRNGLGEGMRELTGMFHILIGLRLYRCIYQSKLNSCTLKTCAFIIYKIYLEKKM